MSQPGHSPPPQKVLLEPFTAGQTTTASEQAPPPDAASAPSSTGFGHTSHGQAHTYIHSQSFAFNETSPINSSLSRSSRIQNIMSTATLRGSTAPSFTAKSGRSASIRTAATATVSTSPNSNDAREGSSRQEQGMFLLPERQLHQEQRTKQGSATTTGPSRSYAQSTCSESRLLDQGITPLRLQSPLTSLEPSVGRVASAPAPRRRDTYSTNTQASFSRQISMSSPLPPPFPDLADNTDSFWTVSSQHGSHQQQQDLSSADMQSSTDNILCREVPVMLKMAFHRDSEHAQRI